MFAGGGTPAAVAATAVTKTIPIVFTIGTDPVRFGLVASINRPGGNATGVSQLAEAVVPKLVELLHQVVPAARTIGVIADPTYPNTERRLTEAAAAARTLGLRLHILPVTNDPELDAAFATLVQERIAALIVITGIGFMQARTQQIVTMAARHAIPAIYDRRLSVAAGGLMVLGDVGDLAHRDADQEPPELVAAPERVGGPLPFFAEAFIQVLENIVRVFASPEALVEVAPHEGEQSRRVALPDLAGRVIPHPPVGPPVVARDAVTGTGRDLTERRATTGVPPEASGVPG